MLKVLIRYAKFASTSVVGSIVDTLVLWLLSDMVFTKGYLGEYIISPIISFQCAVAVNYTISYFYVSSVKSSPESVGDESKSIQFAFFTASW